jgi:vacuolar iron transporter family protein
MKNHIVKVVIIGSQILIIRRITQVNCFYAHHTMKGNDRLYKSPNSVLILSIIFLRSYKYNNTWHRKSPEANRPGRRKYWKKEGKEEIMPDEPHVERHFRANETVRDIVIGMSDGLTVPFALAAGISGAGAATKIVVLAGLTEIAAGSIAMGLGGYLAARTDFEHYITEKQRENWEIDHLTDAEKEEVAQVFRNYGMNEAQVHPIVQTISKNRERWIDFMMKFELGLEKPDPKRAQISALTIGLSYIVGGFIPLSPYMLIQYLHTALLVSVIVTLVALFLFGYIKGRFTGTKPLRNGLQTVVVGGLAAGAAFLLARLIG